jgi:hypothetical protein
MPGFAKRQNTNKNKKGRTAVVPANREYYFGANATRSSICNNPGAYASPKDPNFGLKTFGRVTMMPSEEVRDAQAEREMNKGYSRKRNPVCTTCYIQTSTTGKCGCE